VYLLSSNEGCWDSLYFVKISIEFLDKSCETFVWILVKLKIFLYLFIYRLLPEMEELYLLIEG